MSLVICCSKVAWMHWAWLAVLAGLPRRITIHRAQGKLMKSNFGMLDVYAVLAGGCGAVLGLLLAVARWVVRRLQARGKQHRD